MSDVMNTQLPAAQRANVGTCPACRGYLWADVWITVHVSEPTISEKGTANVHACAKPTAMRLHHECDGRNDEETP